MLSLIPLIAQGLAAPPPGPGVTPQLTSDLNLLIVIAVPIIVAILKMEFKKIPSWILPIIAPLMGVGIDLLAQWAGMHGSGTVAAAVLGSAGVGLREIYDQVKGVLPQPSSASLISPTEEPLTPTKADALYVKRTEVVLPPKP